jgi:hypothetical protein
MKLQIITANFLKTICWQNAKILDWASGISYSLNGDCEQFGVHYSYSFDSAISSAGGEYTFLYQKLGTKGILLKHGQYLREINRTYYCADVYEFPAAIAVVENKTYLIHCPINYNRLDFEEIDTGEIVTDIKGRNPDDRFHSRLETSPDGTQLMSKGWIWHPVSDVSVYSIKDCINEPHLLDCPQFHSKVGVEICTASFIDNETILLGSSEEVFNDELLYKLPPQHITRWHFKTNQLSTPVSVKSNFGNLFCIDADKAWDLYGYPKIVNINTGEILECDDKILTGKQQSSIIRNTPDYPSIIYSRETKQIAVKMNDKVYVVSA